MKEQRTSPRIEHQGEAQLFLREQEFDAEIANISEGGVLIMVENPAVGELLEKAVPARLVFCLPIDPEEDFDVSVKISHFHLPDEGGYRIGMQFTDVEQPGVIAVRDFIDLFSAFL